MLFLFMGTRFERTRMSDQSEKERRIEAELLIDAIGPFGEVGVADGRAVSD
jgi:hypothetical protein